MSGQISTVPIYFFRNFVSWILFFENYPNQTFWIRRLPKIHIAEHANELPLPGSVSKVPDDEQYVPGLKTVWPWLTDSMFLTVRHSCLQTVNNNHTLDLTLTLIACVFSLTTCWTYLRINSFTIEYADRFWVRALRGLTLVCETICHSQYLSISFDRVISHTFFDGPDDLSGRSSWLV